MAEVKWIKICTDIFDDEKMSLIDGMPENDTILVIWFKLLCMAGKQNNGGIFMLNDKIAYTDEMLATIFRRPLNTVRLALTTFEQFGMIEIVNNAYIIPNWEKHQNIEGLEKIREQNRLRKQKQREKERLLLPCHVTVTQSHATDIEKELDKNKTNYEHIKDMYNATCVSLPSVKTLSDARKKAIKARCNKYTLEQIKEVFIKAENSDFLKGSNKSNWTANFDWLIKDSNFAKVLDGNYDNKEVKPTQSTSKYATLERQAFLKVSGRAANEADVSM